MTQKVKKFNETIDNHPIKTLAGAFSTGFGIAFLILNFYYLNRIEDIKENAKDKLDQQINNCENQINLKIIETQSQEREKYYIKVEENSMNGKLLEKTLELIEKKGKDEK